MERLKRTVKYVIGLSLMLSLGGCTMQEKQENQKNYETKEEAGQAVLTFLEKKYHKKFELVGEGTLGTNKNVNYFETTFKDEDGLKAEIQIPQEQKSSFGDAISSGIWGTSDTYSHVVYTKKARDAVEPLFEGEPFEKYFINLEGAGHAKSDLSFSADEYFQKYQKDEAHYRFYILLKDGQSVEYYANIIYLFYQKLITEQQYNFGLVVYTDKKEIFGIRYINSKGFNANKPYDEVLENVQDGLNDDQPQPEEKWLRSPYYNGEE